MGGWLKFDYYIKDYVGNTRVVFDANGKTLQKTDYYPFGLEIDGNSPLTSSPVRSRFNRYNFLSKETQLSTGYVDLQARFYDPTTGRFMAVDPETEGQLFLSPYHYSFNSPIRFSDPDGRFPGCCEGLGDFTTGVIQSPTQNIAGAAPINVSPGYTDAYNAGRNVAVIASIVVGATEVAGAALIAGSSNPLSIM